MKLLDMLKALAKCEDLTVREHNTLETFGYEAESSDNPFRKEKLIAWQTVGQLEIWIDLARKHGIIPARNGGSQSESKGIENVGEATI